METETDKEIKEQFEAWNAVIRNVQKERKALCRFLSHLNGAEFVFIGCGTSYYLSLSGAATYLGITGELARAVTASDVFLYPQSLFTRNGKCCGIPISRSGETTETIWAVQHIKDQLNIETLALSCTPDSKLVKLCDQEFIVTEAAEKSVVMTKSFTSMLLIIQFLAALKSEDKKFHEQLEKLPEQGSQVIEKFEKVAKEIAENKEIDTFVFLGQGPYYGLACESMLKMKEMSLSVSEAFHSMEFRHGPISILNNESLVILLMSESSQEQEVKILKEVKELGAKTFIICERFTNSITNFADYVVELKSGLSDYSRLILYMPITQFLGYYRALHNGLNPDNPRHLTQVVVLD